MTGLPSVFLPMTSTELAQGVLECVGQSTESSPTPESHVLTSQLRLRTQAWRTMLKSWGWLGCWWLTYLIEVSLSWLIYPGCPAASDRQPCPREGKPNQLFGKQATHFLTLMQMWSRKFNLFSIKKKKKQLATRVILIWGQQCFLNRKTRIDLGLYFVCVIFYFIF